MLFRHLHCLSLCAATVLLSQSLHAQSAEQRPELVAQTGHVFPVWKLAWNEDGKMLVSASPTESSIVLWDVENERQLRTFNVEAGNGGSFLAGVRSLALSANGRTMAAGTDDGVTVFNVENGKELYHFVSNAQGLGASVGTIAICFSASARLLAAMDGAATQIWDLETGNLVRSLPQQGINMAGDVVFSPDERRLAQLASGQGGSVVRVLDISSGNVQEHRSGARLVFTNRALTYTPDGHLLVLSASYGAHGKMVITRNAGGESEVILTDVISGTEKTLFKTKDVSDEGSGPSATLSTKGGLISVSEGSSLKIIDAGSSRETQSFTVPNASTIVFPNLAASFSTDEKLLATGSPDGRITIWDVATAQPRRRLEGHVNFASAAAFSQDGDKLFTGARTEWDMSSGIGLRATSPQPAAQIAVVSNTGNVLGTANLNDSTVQIWDLSRGALVQTIRGPEDTITNKMALSPEGTILAVTYRQDVASPEARKRNQAAVQQQIHQASRERSRDMTGMTQALMSGNLVENPASEIKLFNIQTGAELETLKGQSDVVGALSFTVDGKKLVSVSKSDVRIWDSVSGKLLNAYITSAASPTPQQNPWSAFNSPRGFSQESVNAAAISPDGQVIAVAEKNFSMQFDTSGINEMMAQITAAQRTRSKRGRFGGVNPLPQLGKKPPPISRPTFDPTKGGMHVEGPLEIFSLSDGRAIGKLAGHSTGADSVAFSPDGKLLASGGDDHVIRLWSLADGSVVREMVGESSGINSLSFSPDGKLLASSANAGASRIWEVETGQPLATLFSLNDGADWLVVSPEGLFDGSPAAWRQIIWRYGGNTFNVYPVEVFFNEFFYPGLLADIYAGKRPKPSVEIARVDRRQPEIKLAVDSSSTGGRTATVSLYVAQAAATAENPKGSGAKELRLFRNGSLVKAWHGDLLQGRPDARFSAPVPLVAGENRFSAYVFNDQNVKSQDAFFLVHAPEALRRPAKTYVLSIGVNKYADPDYNLRFAVDDARSFAETVKQRQETLPIPTTVEIITIFDEQATRANIMNAISQLSKKALPEDHVLIFFASHGTAAKNRFYILPHDLGYAGGRDRLDESSVKNILAHSISDLDLQQAFEPMDAADLVVVIDACNSGQALEAEEKRRGPMNSKGLAQLAYEKGMYILTASQSYQAALEASQLGHGLLTYTLVQEGLVENRADDDPKDGKISIREWLNYSTKRVPEVQEEKLQQARSLRRELKFGDLGKAQSGKSQVPKVFYRRELETTPWIVAEQGVTR